MFSIMDLALLLRTPSLPGGMFDFGGVVSVLPTTLYSSQQANNRVDIYESWQPSIMSIWGACRYLFDRCHYRYVYRGVWGRIGGWQVVFIDTSLRYLPLMLLIFFYLSYWVVFCRFFIWSATEATFKVGGKDSIIRNSLSRRFITLYINKGWWESFFL